MHYRNLFFSGLLFTLTFIPLQILGEHGRISFYTDEPTLTFPGSCGKEYIYDYYIALSPELIDNNKPFYCGKCIKIVYNNKYAVGRINDRSPIPKYGLDVSPRIFSHLEKNMYDVGIIQADWSIVSCDLYGEMGECSNSSCDESDQLKTTTTKTITSNTTTATVTTIPTVSTTIPTVSTTIPTITTTISTVTTPTVSQSSKTGSKNSFIIIGSIILGCITAVLIGGLTTFMLIKKNSKKLHNSNINSNEEFRNGSIKVVLNNNSNNNNNNSYDANVEINENGKVARAEINNKNKHSIIGINNNSKITTPKIIKINNFNEVVKNSKDAKTENNNNISDAKVGTNNNNNNNSKDKQFNLNQNNLNQNNLNQNSFNHNSLNQNSLNQNSLNQNSLNQNSLNQNNLNQNNLNQNNLNQNILNQNILSSLNENSLNQNNLNQNMINSNNFNFNSLLGRNVFIYNFQNSGDFVMSSIPLFNNNNNNQNNNDSQRVPPSYEEEEPLPEYSDVNKSMEKQQFM